MVFSGDRRCAPIGLIYVFIASHLLCKGFFGYLVPIIDMQVSKIKLENITVVKNFLDVFPEDFPGLPLEKYISFPIDLAPDTTPILLPPYMMAPNHV